MRRGCGRFRQQTNPDVRRPLITDAYELRILEPSDRHELFAHLADPTTVEFMDIAPMASLSDADAMIAWTAELEPLGGAWWAIRERSGAFVGTAGLVVGERIRGSRGEVSYNVVRSRWRTGVMTQVLPALLAHGHGALELRRIDATVTPGNVGYAALLERHGFVREGTLRDHAYWKGRFWDQWLFSHLDA